MKIEVDYEALAVKAIRRHKAIKEDLRNEFGKNAKYFHGGVYYCVGFANGFDEAMAVILGISEGSKYGAEPALQID